ncbi:MAG: hypothetical protein B6D39_00150 [Anaerolineae bacterium UTCFX2]|nr:MAG: hypothetical protein B6D39_00150 [Anaerolineae bacterium UTCFX2]
MFEPKVYFSADTGGAGSSDGESKQNDSKDGKSDQKSSLSYEAWVKDQPEEIKTMLSGWERGLKTALDGERDARKGLEKQVRDLAGKAEKGSEAEKQLTQLADQITESDRRSDFYEAAHAAGVTNLKLAYLVALHDDLFDKRGMVNFETMKGFYPELFGGQKLPKGNAGDGTGTSPTGKNSMNDYIRAAAGRS